MQQISFEISIDSSRTDAFVLVSSKLIKSFFAPYYGSNIPSVVPLKLSDGKRDMYVGCFTNKPHNNNSAESCNNKLFLSVVMGKDLGLEDGEIVHCVPVYKFTKAARVLVLPASVDESEVVEQNALRIEAQLLRQVQVIFPGMIISVAVFAGVHAKVVVQKIEDSQSREMTSGCAIMTEGTEFIIATRTRQICENNIDNNNTAVPMWSILRSQPHSAHEPTSTNLAEMEVSLVMNSATAERYHWKEGLRVGFWDLACMSQLLESKQLTPSFLRANAWQAPIRCSEEVPNGVCTCAALKQSFSNIVVFPNPDENVRHVTVKDIPDDSSLSVLSCKDVDYEQVASVHGDLPQEILNSLSNWFSQRRELRSPFDNNSVGVQGGNGNILLCGGRGYGKTTLVSAVLSKLRDVHVCLVQCTSEANRLLASLQEALVECVLCAPSVLILDNLDAIAPVQREGAVAAVSGTTKSILEGILRYFTDTLTFAGRSSVVVLATCKSREDVHERLRSANYFSKIVKLEPLNRKTRVILLKQMFPQETNDMVEKLASFMDNYTPFDVKKVSARIKSSCKDGVISSFDAMKDIIACFTPLSHTGITFLKGEKRSLDCIGGLSTAKKMLYDTLVLPIKHPELFSRLPLKTRSGILLYGPSGCGKTFLVETLVNATDLNCIVVNGPEVFGKYIGQSEEKIRDVFERAQAAAPCVIFFDEFDSVAPHRGVDNSGVTDRVVNQLLCYLDGVEGRKDVYVVAASSRPDLIDAALLRPGRLDKAVECPIPCYEERLEILTSCFKRVSANITQDDIEAVARQTVNWSPADLSGLVSSANLFVSRRVIESLSLNNTEMNSEMNFAVANVGKGTTMEKIEDALKLLVGTAKPKQALDIVATRMDMEDVRRALEVTRPSLTPKDISEYNGVRSLFTGKDARDKPINVGNKLALQ